MNKKLTKVSDAISFMILISFGVFICFDRDISVATIDGVKLWFACVFPALFPYLFITAILNTLSSPKKIGNYLSPLTNKIYNINGNIAYAILISVISGYPMGAKIVSDLKNENLLTENESVRASCICSFSSPTFLISSVGGIMFCDIFFGVKLFFVHIISSLLSGFIFSFYKRDKINTKFNKKIEVKKNSNILYDSALSSVLSVLVVGALITVFYVLTEILIKIKIFDPIINMTTQITGDNASAKAIIYGLFECTKGLKALSNSNGALTFPLCAFLCGFGGLSIIAQSVAYLKNAKIKIAPFFLSKVVTAILSFIFALILNF